jgi:4-amino-4-deoxy-L-arabinose transferase-like glycosyltransferase
VYLLTIAFNAKREARSDMMTLTFALFAVSSFFLWRRQARWGWAAILAALVLGIIIFLGDVDFSSNLGVQL